MSNNNNIFSLENYKNLREDVIQRSKTVIGECDKYYVLQIRYFFWLIAIYCYFKVNNEFSLGQFLCAVCMPEIYIVFCIARHRQTIMSF